MLREEKNRVIDKLSEMLISKKIILFVKHSNLSVSFIDDLRIALKACDAYFKVVKNRLCKIAFQRNGLNYDNDFFVGPNSVAFSDNPIEMVKILFEFSKKNNNLKISHALLDKDVLRYEDLLQLSKVPNLETIRHNILQSLLFPGKRILQDINSSSSKLIYLLNNFSNVTKE